MQGGEPQAFTDWAGLTDAGKKGFATGHVCPLSVCMYSGLHTSRICPFEVCIDNQGARKVSGGLW